MKSLLHSGAIALAVLVAITLLLVSCGEKDPVKSTVVRPVAAFEADTLTGIAPLAVTFTDKSTNSPTSWHWDFGDGSSAGIQNPSHAYQSAGDYSVMLIVSNSAGADTAGSEEPIQVFDKLTAAFSCTPDSGVVPLQVQFTDHSVGNPTTWAWDFGNGETSSIQNPSHTFEEVGDFAVSLIVSNDMEVDTAHNYMTVKVERMPERLTANFVADKTSGLAPLLVEFTDASGGNPTAWHWAFGDGGTSTNQNPYHQYQSSGEFPVTLVVSNDAEEDTSDSPIIIMVMEAVAADFEVNPQSGLVPLNVSFLDQSTGDPTSWHWDFGDGASSTDQSPTHLFETPGEFNVTLIASHALDADTVSKTVQAIETLSAAYEFSPKSGTEPLEVHFTDRSVGNPISWQWNFGDGNSSGLQNPTHIYAAKGIYPITLIVSNAYDVDTAYQMDTVFVYDIPLPDFSANVTIGRPPLNVTFTDMSAGEITSWNWEFGDSGTSTAQNPSHVYSNDGTYDVRLAVSGPGGDSSITKQDYITVNHCYNLSGPTANFSRSPSSGAHPVTVQFNDQSTAASGTNIASWKWNFGDGNTSTAQNPAHVYPYCGTYTVSLEVTDACGRKNTKTWSSCVSVYAQTAQVTVSPGTKGPYWPTKIEGDCEFDGHGPSVTATVSLELRNGNRELWTKIYMKARETVSNWSTAEGTWYVKLYTAPSGWSIQNYPPSSCSDVYTDANHDYHIKSCDLCTIKTMGDTGGDDICNTTMDDTHIIAIFNTINVSIIETDCK